MILVMSETPGQKRLAATNTYLRLLMVSVVADPDRLLGVRDELNNRIGDDWNVVLGGDYLIVSIPSDKHFRWLSLSAFIMNNRCTLAGVNVPFSEGVCTYVSMDSTGNGKAYYEDYAMLSEEIRDEYDAIYSLYLGA